MYSRFLAWPAALLAAPLFLIFTTVLAQDPALPPSTLRVLVFGERADGHRLVAALGAAEKERGITINTSHVEYHTTNRRQVGRVAEEVLISGVGFDVAVLPAEGPSPDGTPSDGEVDETLALCRLVGIPRACVVMAAADATEASVAAAYARLAAQGFAGDNAGVFVTAMPVEVCHPDAGIQALLEKILSTPPAQPDLAAPFLLPVEDVEVAAGIRGRGTVATGRIETGVIQAGEAVELVGLQQTILKATVTGVEMFRKILDRGEDGDNVGLLLRGIEKKDIRRGMVIVKPGSVKPHSRFVAEVVVLKKEEGGRHTPFQNRRTLTALVRTAEVGAEARPVEAPPGVVSPTVTVTVKLIVPIAMDKGLRFAIREGGRIVGVGQVVEILE